MHPLVSQLINEAEVPCISLYMPVLHGLAHAQENIERLNRLLDDVTSKLQQYGIAGKAQSQFLASARAFADTELASGVSEGTLALFLSPSSIHTHILPHACEERVLIGERFIITPLLPYLFGSMHYYILAVSRNVAHFLEAKNGEVHAMDIPDMPHSQADAWAGMDNKENSVLSNTKDDTELETKVYLQKIAKSLHTFLHEQQLPLVFVGVSELHGMYKHLDTSGRLLEAFAHGNPDHMQGEEILKHTDPIVKEAADKRKLDLLEAYGNVAGTGRTSTDLSDILDAANAGKVDMLFVAEGAQQWGTFNTESGKKELHEGPVDGNEELLGLAANHTLRHRGQLVTLPLDHMPEGKQIAAILRY